MSGDASDVPSRRRVPVLGAETVADTFVDTAHEGVRFGDYRLVGRLGEGGMARVYRAEQRLSDGTVRVVALKALPASATARETDLKALVNEARLGGYLDHPNIVKTHEWGDVAGHWYMSMELVEGWSCWVLLTTCRALRQHPPPSVVVDILRSVLQGLSHAHARVDESGVPLEIIHRDLKPGNILVTTDGRVKLADFGIAQATSNIYKTKTGEGIKGTLSYMSPDQLFDAREELDHRSDLFSLASVIIELATLESALRGRSPADTIDLIGGVNGAKTSAPVEERIPGLGAVLAKMHARRKADRYADADAVLADIDRLALDLPEGPSVAQWLEGLSNSLPELAKRGDFGPDGAPSPIPGDDPQEAPMELPALDTEAAVRAPELASRAKARRSRERSEPSTAEVPTARPVEWTEPVRPRVDPPRSGVMWSVVVAMLVALAIGVALVVRLTSG